MASLQNDPEDVLYNALELTLFICSYYSTAI